MENYTPNSHKFNAEKKNLPAERPKKEKVVKGNVKTTKLITISGDAIKENKVILIKIPEQYFKSRMIRNVIATYFLNKVWISKQIDSSTHTELFFDEIHQCYNCQLLMQNILVECRKFQLTPTLALHYLDRLTPVLY